MSIEEKYEQYESYLDGSMSEEERNLFETSLENPDAKKEFEEYGRINSSFARMLQHEEKEKDFITNLQKIAKNYSNESAKQVDLNETKSNQSNSLSFSKNIKWILSAAAVLLVAFFSYQQYFMHPQSMHDLYASNYTPEEISIERGDKNDSLEKIITLYQAKNYTQALEILTPYSKLHPEQANLKIVIAICKLETNQYADAEKELSAIINLNDAYKEKAQWYLAMLYLKQEQREKCISLLQTFNEHHFYYSKAKIILKELN
jgi:predicted negative regulator of RcsB-dependent stress response